MIFSRWRCLAYRFRINTQQYSYLLRCHANPGDYNFYLFAYMTEHLDRHMENAGRGIRFITPDYLRLMPPHWSHLRTVYTEQALRDALEAFWQATKELSP